ncbi:MAG: acyl carrier protein [Actinomycetota bacterium]|nr:acyl carrier protein [Actinomycetota bacterium]
MSTDIRQFVISALREMNYPVAEATDDTPLGADGIELESLGFAELGLRIEETYGFAFTDEETDALARMTLGEFVAEVEKRREPAVASAE